MANVTIYGSTQKVIFYYAIIEAHCSDDQVKGVQIGEGLLYIIVTWSVLDHQLIDFFVLDHRLIDVLVLDHWLIDIFCTWYTWKFKRFINPKAQGNPTQYLLSHSQPVKIEKGRATEAPSLENYNVRMVGTQAFHVFQDIQEKMGISGWFGDVM